MAMATATAEQKYISVAVAAALAGLSTTSIRRAIRAGKLGGYRPNRRVLVDPVELDAFVRGTGKADEKEG